MALFKLRHLMLDSMSAAAYIVLHIMYLQRTSNYAASLEHILASSNSTNIDATNLMLNFVVVMFTASDARLQGFFASIVIRLKLQ